MLGARRIGPTALFATCGVLGLASSSGGCSPPENAAAVAAEPEAWRYSIDAGTGGFVRVREGRWRETTPGGDVLWFTEVARTAGHVDLRDATRDIEVRLGPDRSEFRFGGGAWGLLYRGGYAAPEDVPAPRPAAPTDGRIRVVYFVAADRQPARAYEQKILTVMRLVAGLYRSDLESKGYRPRALEIEQDAEGRPLVHVVRGERPAAFYNGAPAYDVHAQERRVFAEIPSPVADPRRHVVIVFAETYDEVPAPVEWAGGLALGLRTSSDGGYGIFSAWILKDELCGTTDAEELRLLFDETPLPGRTAMGDRRRDAPRFQFMEDGLGAVAHELGHALGLAHDTRDDDRDVMGQGFRNLRRNFAPGTPQDRRVGFSVENARMLMTSRSLATDLDLTDDEPPSVALAFAGPLVAGATSVTVRLVASDGGHLRAATIFDPQRETVAWGLELRGNEATLEPSIAVRPLAEGEFRLEVWLADGGGNMTRVTARGVVAAKGE